ncbi:MAG: adenylyltransferase/cytidyltransferase family protein, partial [Magnetococcales bacterium]|nr:adenylyltransferase/cytidyltransferase family protein [Magnetococcales bacterium]
MNHTAIYAGSFDPLTLGHMDIIQRGSKIFDRLIVAVAVNIEKKYLFSASERVRLLKECTGHIPGVEILP